MKTSQKIRSIDYETISDFTTTIRYDETDPSIPISNKPRHIHATCEILIHISGDITFNIEDNLYPVMPGNIIITRPYEYHNCIYRSNKPHKHFCIFLSAQNNEYLYDLFYNRNAGENNLLILPGEDAEKFCDIYKKAGYKTIIASAKTRPIKKCFISPPKVHLVRLRLILP